MNVAHGLNRLLVALFVALFFAFLFGPLVIMVITAFNSSTFPRISPWECFTTDWFGVLRGDRMLLGGLLNTAIIGAGVIVIATPIGLAGALLLAEASPRLRSILYTLMIVPILLPGVVIGISTIIFWNWLSSRLGDVPFLTDGLLLSVLGQVTFIAAYSMLVFTSRLQRFDFGLTEAALDLGATPGQAFRKVMLPFLKPAIGSAAVLAFLSSAENYNTTTFTIGAQSTFTTVLASKVRYGINPSISAVAVIIIVVTLIAAIVNEVHSRRRRALMSGGLARARIMDNPALRIAGHPAFIGLLLLLLVAGAAWRGSQYDSSACKAQVLEEKRALQEKLMREQAAPPASSPTAPSAAPPSTGSGPGNYGNVFAPGNLPGGGGDAPPASPAPGTGSSPNPYGNVFSPGSLTAPGASPQAPSSGNSPPANTTNPYGNVFTPGNLPGTAPPAGPDQR